MKRLILCLMLVCCLTLSVAYAEVGTIFDRDFFLSTGIWRDESQFSPQTFSAVASGNSVWTVLYEDNSIWHWDADTGEYTYVTKVDMAEMTEKSLDRLSASERDYQMTSVTDLIGWNGKLYGFNVLSGRLGPIDEEGVHWSETRMDTAPALKPGTGYPSCHYFPTIVGDRLYMLCDLVQMMGGSGYQPALISCPLDGAGSRGDTIPGLLSLCRYDNRRLLFLTMSGLELYDTTTAQTTPLSLALPVAVPQSGDFWDIHGAIGGLAYDAARDTIFLATPTALYASTAGEAFVAYATGQDWSLPLELGHPAFVLNSGAYVLYGDGMDTYLVQR